MKTTNAHTLGNQDFGVNLHRAAIDEWVDAIAREDWERVEAELGRLFAALDGGGWFRRSRWSEPPPAEAP